MRYTASLRYLHSFLNLERIQFHPQNRLWNLERIRFLMDWFGDPSKSFFPILIAGTKGKGSTGFFLESILKGSGIPVGFYSSPHLEDPRERIRLQGKLVSKQNWAEGVHKIQGLLKRKKLPPGFGDFTYFEIMTLLAVLLFKEAKVKIAIFEVGMGGRLDATNILDAELVILTPIHLDHEAFLGNTIAKIAREKAAIIRRGADVVMSPQAKPAEREILSRVRKMNARLWRSSFYEGRLGLEGDFQRINAGSAVKAAMVLRESCGFNVSKSGIVQGLRNHGWPGRLERLRGILLDGAHNPASAAALVGYLKKRFRWRESILIFGTSRDKRSDLMLQKLGGFFPTAILTRAATPRAQEIGKLLIEARPYFKTIYPAATTQEALDLARRLSGPKTLIVVTGSFYLIGEARKILR